MAEGEITPEIQESIEKAKVMQQGKRTVMRVELPPGTVMNRKARQMIKASVRKQVKAEKKRVKREMIHAADRVLERSADDTHSVPSTGEGGGEAQS